MIDLKYILFIFIGLLVLGFIIGGISFLISPPSIASYDDSVTIDIGQDGYLIANINKSLQYKSENIADGEVKTSDYPNTILKWKDARNISYVDYLGKKSYVIVWKASLDDMGLEVNDTNKKAHDYGSIFNQNGMFAVYYLQYNPQNKMVYGIILDNNANHHDLSDLLYGILRLNKSDVNYHDYSYSSSSSGHYRGVDDSPYSIARKDPDWYYDHYDYGDYDKIDEYLESHGYD